MKKGFLRKVRGVWFRIVLSPYVVPVSTVLFANIFLFSAIIVHENIKSTREKMIMDTFRQNQVSAAQFETNLNQMISSCFNQLEVLDDLDGGSQKLFHSFLEKNRCYEGIAIYKPGEKWNVAGIFPEKDLSLQTGILQPNATLPFGLQSDSLMLIEYESGSSKYFISLNTKKVFGGLLAELDTFYRHQVWIISKEGNWLYHPESEQTGNHISATENSETAKTLHELAEHIARENKSGHQFLFFNSAIHPTSHRSIAFHYPLRSSFIKDDVLGNLLIVVPQQRVLKGVNDLYKRHYLAEGAILGGILLFGLIFASQQQKTSFQLRNIVGEQDQILSSVLANSVDAIIVIDDDDTIQMWNRGAQLIFGYASDETLGQSIEMIIPSDMDAEKEIKWINKQVEKNGYLRNHTTHRITKDGKRITVDETRTRFQSPDGNITGSTAIIKDETNRLQLDQRMYNAEKLASIGLLASGVAHEINNPLAIILGFTDLLKEKFEEDSTTYKDLDMIEYNANQAQKIVKDLLGFSRVSEGSGDDHFELIDSVQIVVDLIQNTKLAKDAEFETDISDHLPPVRGDAREFQQVLLNLINNSVASFDKGKGHIKIRARFLEKRWNVLEIIDDGSGIPLDIQQKIFDPFFTTKDVGEGTGLGLSLCYGIVKKMGGAILLDSHTKSDSPTEKSGTKFIIRLPGYQEIVEEA